jgi:hypothetical protein
VVGYYSVRSGHSSIDVVAHDASGLVFKAWAKSVDSDDPVITKALAINWALRLALLESISMFLWKVTQTFALSLIWVILHIPCGS